MGMCVIATFFGPYAPDPLTSHVSVFSYNFKRFERLTKLATSSIPHDGDTAREALCFEALANDHGRGLGVDLHQTGDLIFEGIELAEASEAGSCQAGIIEVLVHRLSSDTQGPRDFANREAFVGQAVDVKDGAFVNHR